MNPYKALRMLTITSLVLSIAALVVAVMAL